MYSKCLRFHAVQVLFGVFLFTRSITLAARTEPPKIFKFSNDLMTFSSFHASVMRRRKRKKNFGRERERERETVRVKREIFFFFSLKRHAQKSTRVTSQQQFFLLRFNDTHLRHTFCFRAREREREIKRRRNNNVRRSRFCSFFSRRSARGVISINNVSIFIQRTTNSGERFFL